MCILQRFPRLRGLPRLLMLIMLIRLHTPLQSRLKLVSTLLPGPFKLDVSSIPARAVVTYLH